MILDDRTQILELCTSYLAPHMQPKRSCAKLVFNILKTKCHKSRIMHLKMRTGSYNVLAIFHICQHDPWPPLQLTRKKEDNMQDTKKDVNKSAKKLRSEPKSGSGVEDIGSEKKVMRARLRRVSPAPPVKTLVSSNNNKTQGWDFSSMCYYADFKFQIDI